MKRVSVSTTIQRPVEEVFDFLVDSRNDPRWCPLSRNVELVEGTPGLGALYRYEQGQGPGLPWFEAWCQTVEAVHPTRLVWDNAGRGTPYRATIDLSAHGTHTRMQHTNEVDAPNLAQQLAWFAGAQVVMRLQLRKLSKELDR